jgi:hypothetical protein
MSSTLASKSPYLYARIHPPLPGESITQIVLTETYHDALEMYKTWLQEGVVIKFRRANTSPVPTVENTFLWSECFDLVRAHITATRFGHTQFEDFVMDELVRWLDPVQDADPQVLDFVFAEQGVSEKLQSFVVDRMFAEDEQVRRIFTLYLARKEQERVGGFRLVRPCEYHAHEAGRCGTACFGREDDGGRLVTRQASVKRVGFTDTLLLWEHSADPFLDFDGDFEEEREWMSRTPTPEVPHVVVFPPSPPSPTSHHSMLDSTTLPEREETEHVFTDVHELLISPPNTVSVDVQPIAFPPAPYLRSALNHAIVQTFSIRRKPVPPKPQPLTSIPMPELPEPVPLVGLAKQSSWPLSTITESGMVAAAAAALGSDRARPKITRSELVRGKSAPRKPTERRVEELQGRAVTPEELLKPQLQRRPGSAP